MSPNDFEFPWWLRAIAFAALAAFGGLMGSILRSQHANTPISGKRILVETLASGFVGLLTMLICNEMGLSQGWTGVIVGVFGWLGANSTILVLEKLIYKKIGIEKPTENTSAPDPKTPQ